VVTLVTAGAVDCGACIAGGLAGVGWVCATAAEEAAIAATAAVARSFWSMDEVPFLDRN
jgi:hypothetical protein